MRESLEGDRRKLEAEQFKLRESLEAQIPALEKTQNNPELYADAKMEEERRRASDHEFLAPASGSTLNVIARMDGTKNALERLNKQIDDEQGMHRRLVEAIAREV